MSINIYLNLSCDVKQKKKTIEKMKTFIFEP